jgi:hypothetical protein
MTFDITVRKNKVTKITVCVRTSHVKTGLREKRGKFTYIKYKLGDGKFAVCLW